MSDQPYFGALGYYPEGWFDAKPYQGLHMNELTVDKIGEGIKEFIRHQARLPDGPDLGGEVVVSGLVRDDDLRRVLEVKGELVIRIRAVPEQLVDVDADRPVVTGGMADLQKLASLAGARRTEAPVSTE